LDLNNLIDIGSFLQLRAGFDQRSLTLFGGMGQRQTMQQEIDEIAAAIDGELYITEKPRGEPELQLAEFLVEESKLVDLLITLLYSSAFGGRVLLSFPGRDVKV